MTRIGGPVINTMIVKTGNNPAGVNVNNDQKSAGNTENPVGVNINNDYMKPPNTAGAFVKGLGGDTFEKAPQTSFSALMSTGFGLPAAPGSGTGAGGKGLTEAAKDLPGMPDIEAKQTFGDPLGLTADSFAPNPVDGGGMGIPGLPSIPTAKQVLAPHTAGAVDDKVGQRGLDGRSGVISDQNKDAGKTPTPEKGGSNTSNCPPTKKENEIPPPPKGQYAQYQCTYDEKGNLTRDGYAEHDKDQKDKEQAAAGEKKLEAFLDKVEVVDSRTDKEKEIDDKIAELEAKKYETQQKQKKQGENEDVKDGSSNAKYTDGPEVPRDPAGLKNVFKLIQDDPRVMRAPGDESEGKAIGGPQESLPANPVLDTLEGNQHRTVNTISQQPPEKGDRDPVPSE